MARGWVIAYGVRTPNDLLVYGYEWTDHSFTQIAYPKNSKYTYFRGINNNGEITGQNGVNGTDGSFFYSSGSFTWLPPGSFATNDNNMVVGMVPPPTVGVPEIRVWLMMLLGLCAVFEASRINRRFGISSR